MHACMHTYLHGYPKIIRNFRWCAHIRTYNTQFLRQVPHKFLTAVSCARVSKPRSAEGRSTDPHARSAGEPWVHGCFWRCRVAPDEKKKKPRVSRLCFRLGFFTGCRYSSLQENGSHSLHERRSWSQKMISRDKLETIICENTGKDHLRKSWKWKVENCSRLDAQRSRHARSWKCAWVWCYEMQQLVCMVLKDIAACSEWRIPSLPTLWQKIFRGRSKCVDWGFGFVCASF